MATFVQEAAVDLARYLHDERAGRGVFRLHGIDRARCACGERNCANVRKHPAYKRWGERATLDPRAVEQTFRQYPDAGVGIATGRGLLVLDFDKEKGGIESLGRLEDEYPDLDLAPALRTGGGGMHIYLRVPDGVYVRSRANALPDLPGVDVRSAGGYVVAPPTMHRSGRRYEWIDRPPLSGCPDELTSRLTQRETRLERGGADRERSRLPLSPTMQKYLRDGIPLDAEGGQRGVICALSRALLELPSSVEEATEAIWEALQRSEWSDPAWPWTEENVYEIVADIEHAGRPQLRNGHRTARINVKRRVRRER